MEKFTQAPVGLDIDQTVSSNSQAIAKVQNGLAYIVGNTNTTGGTLAVGQFVYVKNHSTIAEGLRTVTASISANGNITTSNTSACSDGGLNALNSKIDTIEDYTAYGPTYCYLKSKTNVIFIYGSSSGGLTLTGDNAWHSLTTIGPAFRPSYDVYFVGSTASGHSIAFHLATDGTLSYVTDANTSYWSYGGSYVI